MKNKTYECIHIENNRKTKYIFIGDDDKENNDKRNNDSDDNKTIIVKEKILNDDTILDVQKKIIHHIKKKSAKAIYCWCKSDIRDNDKTIRDFLDGLFHEQYKITKDYLHSSVLNLFNEKIISAANNQDEIDYSTAYKLCKDLGIKYIFESLTTDYFKNDSEYSFNYPIDPLSKNIDSLLDVTVTDYDVKTLNHKTIESFAPKNKIIYFIDDSYTFNFTNFYFPEHQQSLKTYHSVKYDQINNVYNNIEKHKYNINKPQDVLSYALFRINENRYNNKPILNLENVFQYFRPTYEFPFIKLVTKTNIFFRIQKKTKIEKENLVKWTKINKGRQIKNEYIIIKIRVDDKYHNLFLLSTGVIDIQCLFGVSKVNTNEYIANTHFPVFNKCMKLLYDKTNIIKLAVFNLPPGSSIYTVKFSMIGSINSKKTLTIQKVSNIIDKHLEPFFNISNVYDDKIELIYKRDDYFTADHNISLFIKKNGGNYSTRAKMTKNISKYFSIDIDTAEEYYDRLKDSNIFYKHYLQTLHDNTVVIVSPSVNGYNFIITGLTSDIIKKRIYNLLYFTINGELEKGKLKQIKIKENDLQLQIVENESDDDESNEENYSDQDGDDIRQVMEEMNLEQLAMWEELKLALNEDDGNFDNADNNVDNNKDNDGDNNEANDAANDEDNGDNDDNENTKVRSAEILKSLHTADLKLFKPDNLENGKYAKTCQMTIKRQPRQPIVVTNEELQKIKATNDDSIKNHLSMGSTLQKKEENNYICPQVWCPKSRMALSKETFEKNGRKCPNANDYPVVYYESSYFKDKVPYVDVMKLKGKSASFEVPCCFTKLKKIRGENEGIDTLERKYILKESNIPLDEGRYGIMPSKLSYLLGNTGKIGDRDDGTGNMDHAINARLRVGVKNTPHSFLECIVYLLGIRDVNNVADLLDILVKNIDMATFMTLSNGTVCRKFINDDIDIYDPVQFVKFKKWFLNEDNYIQKFGIKHIYNNLYAAIDKEYSDYMDGDQHIVREFILYNAYMNFINYLQINNIVKSHDILLDIFNENLDWLNPKRYNFILFEYVNEEVLSYCNKYKNQIDAFDINKPYVIILKQGLYYEPIVNVNITDGNFNVAYLYERNGNVDQINVFKIIDFLANNCKSDLHESLKDNEKIIKIFSKDIKYFVLDYHLRCVGILLNTQIYIPFEKPSYMLSDLKQYNKRYQFVDEMYSLIKKDIDKSSIVDALKMIKNPKYEIESSSDGYVVTKFNQVILTRKLNKKSEFYNKPLNDLHIFTKWKIKDPRILFIDKYTAIENMKNTVLKEINYAILRDRNENPDDEKKRRKDDVKAEKEKYNKKDDVKAYKKQMVAYEKAIIEYEKDKKNLTKPIMPKILKTKFKSDYKAPELKFKIKESLHYLKFVNKTLSHQQKKDILYDDIKKVIPEIMLIVDASNRLHMGDHIDRPCSKIGKPSQCISQCSMIQNFKNGVDLKKIGLNCRLRVPRDIFDMLISVTLDKLLDINYNIDSVIYNNVNNKVIEHDFITFSEIDLKDDSFIKNITNTGVAKTNMDMIEFDINSFTTTTAQTRNDTNFIEYIVTPIKGNLLSCYDTMFSTFKKATPETYDMGVFYKIFANIYSNIMNESIGDVELKNMVKDKLEYLKDFDDDTLVKYINQKDFTRRNKSNNDVEKNAANNNEIENIPSVIMDSMPGIVHLYCLSKILKTHIMVFGRVIRPHYTQDFRCIDPIKNIESRAKYILLSQSKTEKTKDDKFDVVSKKIGNDFKYIFNDSDFGTEALGEIKKRCGLYTL